MLKKCDVKFSNLSLVDDFGRVFFYKDKVYRAIQFGKEGYCRNLIDSEMFKELQEKGLTPVTKVSDLQVEGLGLILEHEKLTQTLKHEWTFNMLRDAALSILKVNEICNKFGYELKDAHFYNMLFRGIQPVWIDIGSIEKINIRTNNWKAYEGFLNTAVVPITFLSKNMIFIGSKLLESIYFGMMTIPSQSFEESGLLELLKIPKEPYLFNFRSLNLIITKDKIDFLDSFTKNTASFIQKITGRKTILFSYKKKSKEFTKLSSLFPIKNIKKYLNELPAPEMKSMWQGYHEAYRKKEKFDTDNYRFKRILEIIKTTKDVQTIIDLAGNEGYFSELLWQELNLKQLIVVDYDSNAIDNCYKAFKSLNAGNVISLQLNFMYTPDNDGTPTRLRSDLVIALAVTHHLILSANYSLQSIFEKLESYTNRYVIVEFMPLGLWSSEQSGSPSFPEWYNIDWFRSIFKDYFKVILEEQTETNRILFYGELSR